MLIQFTKTKKPTRRSDMGGFRPYRGGATSGVKSALSSAGGLKSLIEQGGAPYQRLLNELVRLVGRKDAFVVEELKIALAETADQGVNALGSNRVNAIVTDVRKRVAVIDFEKSLEPRVQRKAVRRIRTPEGARMYGQPIGSIITRDMIEAVGDPDEVDKPDAAGDTKPRPAADLKPGDHVSFTKPGPDGKPQTVEGTVDAVETDGDTTTVTVDGEAHKLGAKNPVESTRAGGGGPEPDSRSTVLEDLRQGRIDKDEARRRIALVDAGTPEMVGEFDPDTEDYDPDVADQSDDELLSNHEAAVEDGDTELADGLRAELDRRGLSADGEDDAGHVLRGFRGSGIGAEMSDEEFAELEERFRAAYDPDNPQPGLDMLREAADAYRQRRQDDLLAEYEEPGTDTPIMGLNEVAEEVRSLASDYAGEQRPDAVEYNEHIENAARYLDDAYNASMDEEHVTALEEAKLSLELARDKAGNVEDAGTPESFSDLLADIDLALRNAGADTDESPDLLVPGTETEREASAGATGGRSIGDDAVIGDTVEVDGRIGEVREIRSDGALVVRWDDDDTLSAPLPPDNVDLVLDPTADTEATEDEAPNLLTTGDHDEELQKARDDDEYDTSVELDGEEEYLTVLPPVSQIAEHLKARYSSVSDLPVDDEDGDGTGLYQLLEDLDYPVDGDDDHAMEVLLNRIDKAKALAFGSEGDGEDGVDSRAQARGDGTAPLPEGKYPAGDPRNDPEYEAYTEELDTKIKQALADGLDTESQYSVKVGNDVVWTPTRARMHDEIIDEIMAASADVPRDRKAIMMGGLPGAGTSTFLRQHGHRLGLEVNSKGDPTNAIVVNPDEMKALLLNREGAVPRVEGLTEGEHASLIHEESSHLAKMLAARVLADGYNVVFDITLGDGKKAKSKYLTNDKGTGARDLGYNVYAAFVDGDMPTSLHRAGLRHKKPDSTTGERSMTGRYVSYGHILSEAPSPGATTRDGEPAKSKNRVEYDALVEEEGTFDFAIRMDNVTGQFAVDKEGENLPFTVPDDLRAAAYDDEVDERG